MAPTNDWIKTLYEHYVKRYGDPGGIYERPTSELNNDCLPILANLEDQSVDVTLTDPPCPNGLPDSTGGSLLALDHPRRNALFNIQLLAFVVADHRSVATAAIAGAVCGAGNYFFDPAKVLRQPAAPGMLFALAR